MVTIFLLAQFPLWENCGCYFRYSVGFELISVLAQVVILLPVPIVSLQYWCCRQQLK